MLSCLVLAKPIWRQSGARGYWFYQQSLIPVLKKPLARDCHDPTQWHSHCGFIDPSKLTTLNNAAKFAFEQRQYHALLRDLSLNPNDLQTASRWQHFNHWVIEQAMTAAYSTQFLITQHPEWDASIAHPFSRFGIALLKQSQFKKQQHAFALLAKHSLLVFFSRSNCPYCHAQAPLVQHLAQSTHIRLSNASLDQRQLPGFSQVLHPPQTLMPAKILHVKTVPTLFLYLAGDHNAGTWIRVATGVTPEDVMKKRLLQFIRAYRGALISGVMSGGKLGGHSGRHSGGRSMGKKYRPDFSEAR